MTAYNISKTVCVLTILFLISSVLAFAQTQPAGEKQFSLRDGDRVVFYGDSITEQRLYTMAVEEFAVTRFPDLHITFFNAGVGGDKVSGGSDGPIDLRLQADLFAHDPTVITVMLGMNDGYYRPYDPQVFKSYSNGYRYLVGQIASQAPKARLTLIQPSPYDDVTQEPRIAGGYNNVLLRYGAFVGELAREKNAQAVDFNQPVVDVLIKAKTIDAPLSTRLIPGRVHPSLSIHWIMAESLLKAWNASPIVTAVTVHTDHLASSDEMNTKVTDLRKAGRSFAWTQADRALPLPLPPGDLDPAMDLALRSSDLISSLDQENLKVLGLAAGSYELRIDDSLVGVFSADTLSAGINLATLDTPMQQQARLVGMDAELRNSLEDEHLSLTHGGPKDTQKQIAHELELALGKAMDRERKDAQPVVHHYSLSPAATGKTGTLALAFSPQEPFADVNIAGLWKATQMRDDGSVNETYYWLEQNGAEIKGVVQTGDLPITKGTVHGAEFHFEAWEAGSSFNPWKYDGVVESGRLKITVRDPDPHAKPYEMMAVKVSADGPEVPVRIQPPVLHKVPYNGLAKTPPMGWNSWNHFEERVDDATVRAIADAMVANGMRDAGYVYVNIDDTWEGSRDAQGNIRPNKKFPDMKALADYVHSKGLKLGIYSSPGPKTCANYEGSYGHEEQDAKTYAAWGIDYLKYDWCSASRIYKKTELRAIYQKMSDALQSTGRPVIYSLCEYGKEKVWEWGPLVGGNLWRTTSDIDDTWDSMSKIGFNQGVLAPYAAPGHWNDPDMLEIGNGGMTAEEYRTHMSLWSMLSAPLMAGNDLRSMSSEILEILTNRDVIAIDQDPLGKQATLTAKSGDVEVWMKALANGEEAVAIFNRGADQAKYEVHWADIGLARPSKARDLWSHQDIANVPDVYFVVIPRHATVLLRVSAK